MGEGKREGRWFFTFMWKQGVLREKYVEVEAEGEEEARERMNQEFGSQWAFMYGGGKEEVENFLKDAEEFGMERYALIWENGEVDYD